MRAGHLKSVATRVLQAVLASAQVLYEQCGADADHRMTTVGDFTVRCGGVAMNVQQHLDAPIRGGVLTAG